MRRPVALIAIGLIAACGGSGIGEQGTEQDRQEAAQAALDSARVAALAEEYPRLGQEPLPEPRPSGGGSDASARSLETTRGEATFYADAFEGRRTASGIPFRQNQMVAAHRAYPFGTILRVTNRRNDRSINVRVVDRGPFGTSARARQTVLDLSRRAAEQLGYVAQGRTPVRVEVLEWGQGLSG